jgi:cytochrome c-type biogenesis protein CcmF
LGLGLGVWLIAGSATDVITRCYRRGLHWKVVVERAFGLPRSAWGTALAHAGMGITVIGISATAWGVESLAVVAKHEPLIVGPYTVSLEQAFKRKGEGFREDVAQFSVTEGAVARGLIESSKRIHTGREMPTTEAGIVTYGFGQLYASVNEILPDGRVSIRFYWKPLVTLIWGGAIVMALGGALSLADRRARIALSAKNKRALSMKAEAKA